MSSSRSGTRVLERLAAVHYAERYQLEEAFSVLQRSADYETLIDLVLGHHLEWAATGRPDAVKQWCDAAILADPGRPELYLAKAGASLLAGDTGEAEASVSMVQMLPVDGDRATHIQGEVDMIYAAMHRQRGEFDRCCDAATRAADAVARLPDDYDSVFRGALPGSVPLFLGLAQFACGRVDEARVSLTAAGLDRGYAPVGRALIHGLLSLIAWLTDDPAARIQAAIAVSYVDELTGPGDFVAWCAYAIVGEGAEAVDAAAQVVALLDAVDEPLGVVLGAAVAALRSLDEESRRAHVARAVASIDACPEPGILVLVLRRTMETIESRAQDRVVAPTPNPATLTEGERRVVLALRGNMTEREIASELHLSHNTVRAYRRRAYRKLGVSSREEALQALWLESGDAPPA